MNSPYGLPAECLTCVLRPNKFFCALSEESVQAFSQIKHAAVYPADAIILVEGQSPHGIFILCQGQAKLSTTSRDGKTIILRIVSREKSSAYTLLFPASRMRSRWKRCSPAS
jgi:CRP-like cAMP-binding protein